MRGDGSQPRLVAKCFTRKSFNGSNTVRDSRALPANPTRGERVLLKWPCRPHRQGQFLRILNERHYFRPAAEISSFHHLNLKLTK